MLNGLCCSKACDDGHAAHDGVYLVHFAHQRRVDAARRRLKHVRRKHTSRPTQKELAAAGRRCVCERRRRRSSTLRVVAMAPRTAAATETMSEVTKPGTGNTGCKT